MIQLINSVAFTTAYASEPPSDSLHCVIALLKPRWTQMELVARRSCKCVESGRSFFWFILL